MLVPQFQVPSPLNGASGRPLTSTPLAVRRDDARTVLVAMARELGPSYMPFLCEVLSAALPDKGYTAHVLGHTVHALVEAMHKVRMRIGCYIPS